MESEKCFIYDNSRKPLPKRRRISSDDLCSSSQQRRQLYHEHWSVQRNLIDDVIRAADVEVLERIDKFVASAPSYAASKQLATGLIVTGPASSSQSSLIEQAVGRIASRKRNVAVVLHAAECNNVKGLLRILIKKITSLPDDEQDEDLLVRPNKGFKLLNYDLQNILDWSRTRNLRNITVALIDSEAFDTGVLVQALRLLSSWSDRLPFTILLGIATSANIFQARLPQSLKQYMYGETFHATNADLILEKLFESHISDPATSLRIGPLLAQTLFQRHKDHLQSLDAFVGAVQYAYMSHFFANPLSIFLGQTLDFSSLSADHLSALRNLPSFQRYIESQLEHGRTSRVRGILEDDAQLLELVSTLRMDYQNKIAWMSGAIKTFMSIQAIASFTPRISFSEICIAVMSGRFHESTYLRALFLHIRECSAEKLAVMIALTNDVLITMPASETGISPDDFHDLDQELTDLVSLHGNQRELSKAISVQNVNGSTPGISNKPNARRKTNQKISSAQKAYTTVLQTFQDLLQSYFDFALCPMNEIPFNEIFFYNLKSPHRDVLMCRPRYAIERALSSPHDYLGCNCCKGSWDGPKVTQPITSILYQLYLDSSLQLNSFDLFQAFKSFTSDITMDEGLQLALFYRSLAELRHLGYVKPSRRKVDHLVKLSWKGL